MKEKFSTWYSEEMPLALENGEKFENINISFKITVLKPLNPKWLVEFYNHIASGEKREIITRGLERAGITHALELGSSSLPELDPFAEFSTLVSGDELHLLFYKQSIFDPPPENCLSFSKKLPQKIV